MTPAQTAAQKTAEQCASIDKPIREMRARTGLSYELCWQINAMDRAAVPAPAMKRRKFRIVSNEELARMLAGEQ